MSKSKETKPDFIGWSDPYRLLVPGCASGWGCWKRQGVCRVDPDEAITPHVRGYSGCECHSEAGPDAARRARRRGRVAGGRGALLGRDSGVPGAVCTVGAGGGEGLRKHRLSAWRAGCGLRRVSGARGAERVKAGDRRPVGLEDRKGAGGQGSRLWGEKWRILALISSSLRRL